MPDPRKKATEAHLKGAIEDVEADLKRDPKDLLVHVHAETLVGNQRSKELTVARTMARFASLLVVMSKQSKELSDRNLKMQESLVRLTWYLLIITVMLFLFQLCQLFCN